MRDRASLTAELVCLLRALGEDDSYAGRLLSPPFRALEGAWRAGQRVGLPLDAATLGIRPLVLARHRFIDAALAAARSAGARQFVLLGAGLDARPWRFAEDLTGRSVFLVDHPATARLRAARSAALPPLDTRRVDVDFAAEDFGDALLRAGYHTEIPAFFVWEGVSMYLPRGAVEGTLRRVAELLAPGSSLAMDFWRPEAGGPAVRRLVEVSLRALDLLGEPVHFGLQPAEVGPFLAAQGLCATAVEVPEVGPWPGLVLARAVRG